MSRIRRVLKKITSELWSRTLRGRQGPYLKRFYLFSFLPWWNSKDGSRIVPWLPGALINQFLRSDEDTEHHNHPWKWSFSVVLAGGYIEERLVDGEVRSMTILPGSINFIRDNDFHRVDLIEEDCWTLFITGPKSQSWGFLDVASNTFTPWREFIAKKGLPV